MNLDEAIKTMVRNENWNYAVCLTIDGESDHMRSYGKGYILPYSLISTFYSIFFLGNGDVCLDVDVVRTGIVPLSPTISGMSLVPFVIVYMRADNVMCVLHNTTHYSILRHMALLMFNRIS